ncbi:ABC transporter G family member 36 [Acorus calamus]|uniref:ABC transporter G family member 36 n=1 Tax=Acorus calamus TaxID=4465 RepID=A0AAV9EKX7_ACOCL|nr:ABC transporter G family member 36 [Acorus calamus]
MEGMERVWDSGRRASRNLSRGISRNMSRANWGVEDVFTRSSTSRRSRGGVDDDEEALRWAALEKLPTYDRLRTGIIKSLPEEGEEKGEHREVDVRKLGMNERQEFIERIFKVAEEDNERFLRKFRNRIDKVGITLPTVEVRFEHLTIEADCYIGSRALPTLWNTARNIGESALGLLGIRLAKMTTLTILKDASGIIKPSRASFIRENDLTSGSCGKLDSSLKVKGEITYNGHSLKEFVSQKTSAYISQNDVHIGEMTVKETLDFSARCQGVGSRFGLDICRDTIVGDDMQRGISGGQKKRVTTGEMIVGPTKTLFMDEISTGLDSSTTFQIVKCLQQIVHLTEGTILMSLLQPAPETFNLFDDIILLSEGQIVYQGPREHVVEFFESCGFRCPDRKGTADFLQEVTSRKDQEQYWADKSRPYRYVTVTEFANRFKRFHVGLRLENELSVPYDKQRSHKAALAFTKYSVTKWELLRASFAKEWLLIQRNSFVYIFKTVQIVIVAIIASTVFLRTKMHSDNIPDANLYIGALLFAIIINMFNGFAELSLTIARLPVFYKQRDLLFYPAWAFTIPNFVLRVPISVLEFFKQFLIVFLIQQMAAGLFRATAGLCRTMIISNTGGALAVLVLFLLGGFILPKDKIPKWWIWGYWLSPLTYAYNSMTVNEFFAPRWMDKPASPSDNRLLGRAALENMNIFVEKYWYWIGAAALLGFTIFFNVVFTVSLMYLNPLGKKQAVISEEEAMEMEANQEESKEPPRLRVTGSRTGSRRSSSSPRTLSGADGNNTREMMIRRMSSRAASVNGQGRTEAAEIDAAAGVAPKRGMVLPFTPLAMSFDDVKYYVDMPQEMKDQGVTEDRLQLLRGITGAFRPGVLTALMGVSGAGKDNSDGCVGRNSFQTTLMALTVWKMKSSEEFLFVFADEVMELVELESLRDAIVGLPGVTGLSTEQRKRLTIAVELVANPSIIFMDEAHAIPGVAKITENYNPATWMLEASSIAAEMRLGIDFAEHYKQSSLHQRNQALVKELSVPPPGAKDLYFTTQFSQSTFGQFKSCLWKQWLTYWRSPDYNLDLTMIIGAMYAAILFLGINNCSSVQPIVAVERTVFYREKAAGMYSAMPYAIAQVVLELPYVFVQTLYYSVVVYAMLGFQWTIAKFLWFFYVSYFTFLYWTYYGMMTVSITPNHQIAAIFAAAAFYALFNLFSGFFIPRPWWVWYYWICPVAWTVYGLIVSQYGDLDDTIKVTGPNGEFPEAIKKYIKDQFGYDRDFMGPVAVVLAAFAAFFALMYAYCIKTLNFQQR